MTVSDKEFQQKRLKFLDAMSRYTKQDTAVAFSGGADSSLILKAACEEAERYGSRVYAVTMQTELHTAGDLKTAEEVAAETGAYHIVLQIDELQEAGIEMNPENRCYLCKKLLFTRLRERVQLLGIHTILEGTNADDLKVYRPGIKAVEELGIISPLKDAGFTKQEVRRMASQYGISVAERPAAPCMATRFPYGTRLTREKMKTAAQGEAYIRTLGFYDVRLRVQDDLVRIEVDKDRLGQVLEYSKEITDYLHMLGYRYVTLDLEGFRSGSMDLKLKGKGVL